jgi:hypothetical protein
MSLSASAKASSTSSSAEQQSAAKALATSQRGSLDLYGVAQRLRLNSQTPTPSGNLPIATPDETADPSKTSNATNDQGFTYTKRQSNILGLAAVLE